MNDKVLNTEPNDVDKRRKAARMAFEKSGVLSQLADAVGDDPNKALLSALTDYVDQLGKIPKRLEPVVNACVEAALAAGADPLTRSPSGPTCLSLAVYNGAEKSACALARALIFSPIFSQSPNHIDHQKDVLFIAVKAGMVELTHEIIRSMKTRSQRVEASTEALLWTSSATGSAICQALLDAGADPNSINSRGVPVCWLAARNGPHTLLAALLAQGVSPDSISPMNGFTPLMAAVESSHLEAISLLLKAGADMDIRDCRGETAESLSLKMGPKNEKNIGSIFAVERARRESDILNKDLRAPLNRGPSRVL